MYIIRTPSCWPEHGNACLNFSTKETEQRLVELFDLKASLV